MLFKLSLYVSTDHYYDRYFILHSIVITCYFTVSLRDKNVIRNNHKTLTFLRCTVWLEIGPWLAVILNSMHYPETPFTVVCRNSYKMIAVCSNYTIYAIYVSGLTIILQEKYSAFKVAVNWKLWC